MFLRRIVFVLLVIICCSPAASGQQLNQKVGGPTDGKAVAQIQQSSQSESQEVTLSSITGGTVPCTEGFAATFPCHGIDLAAFVSMSDLPASGDLSDIWGWKDDSTGHEYAIVTQETGTNFVDVTDPENPVIVGMLPIHAGSVANAWHDVRVYRNYAFIVADAAGAAGMQIFDLSQLASAGGSPVASMSKGSSSTPTVFSETAYYGGIASSHNISIDEATGFGYVVGANSGGTTCGGGLHMLDLSTPASPSFAGCFADATTGRSHTGYTHDVQCVVYHGPDTNYQGDEVCFSSNETHLLIADVTDKDNPSTIGKGTYPEASYIHQGWLTEDHRYFLQDDELDEYYSSVGQTTTYLWDVQDLADPVLVDTFSNPIGVIDHNQFVLGRYSIQADYTAGVRVIDFGDVENPSELLYFDTYPAANATIFDGAWGTYPYLPSGVILVSSIQQGFFVLKPSVPLRLALDLKVLLQGPYAGADSMAVGAPFIASLPTSLPYAGPEFNGTSVAFDYPESVATLPPKAVDWVLVELRAAAADTTPVTTEPGILLRDGRVVAPDGDTLRFDGALPGSYWVVVRHRNHLAVMSSSAVDLSSGVGSWDFTDSASKAYGIDPMKVLSDGRYAMYGSDGSIDGRITALDFVGWLNATTAGVTGYAMDDYNLDGAVTATDFIIWIGNTTAGAKSGVPD
ncbi:MAG: choice-of-anchor B family protein [Rhodothermales bacterium]